MPIKFFNNTGSTAPIFWVADLPKALINKEVKIISTGRLFGTGRAIVSSKG